jgi:hypothetical protein
MPVITARILESLAGSSKIARKSFLKAKEDSLALYGVFR